MDSAGSKLLNHFRWPTVPAVICLALTSLACQVSVGGPQAPGEPIPVSTQAAEQLGEAWQAALAGARTSGTVIVLLDETQLTSFLALKLEGQEAPLLRDPQVFLRDGTIQIFGTNEQGPLEATVLVRVAPRLGPDGTILFEIVSADFGPLPAPEALREGVSGLLTEALTTPLGSLAAGVRLTSVTVADGQIAIVGEVR